MYWVSIIWAAVAAACLTLAAVYFMVWCTKPTERARLFFALAATATAAFGVCELWMMHARTTAEYGTAVRWVHLPIWVLIVSLVGFVRTYLHAGRPWLGWTVCGLRTVGLIANFLSDPNLSYREITALRHTTFLGEPIAIGQGVANPWTLIPHLSLVLLVVFATDAAVAVWHRGERRRAVVLGGAIAGFTLAGMAQAVAVVWGLVQMPLAATPCFLGIVAAMAFEINREVLQAARLSEELRESEARLASAVEVGGLGFYDFGADPGQVFLDERLCSMLGLTPQDNHRVQEFWIENVHPDDRDRVQELSRRVLGGELPGTTVEYRFLHPERGTRWFNHVFRAQAQDATGKVIRRLGVIRDITEQRRAELESQRLRDNLAHLTRVNTLGALSGSLAHELNQPLGIILSNAQAAQELLTQEQPDTPEVQAILADIVAADRRAGEIIDRLRALFKGGEVSLQELSLNTLIEEVLSLLHAELLGRGVTIIREMAPDLPLVAGDRVQLQQLVLNLVLNAADAMAANAQGTRQLHLRTMLHLDRARVSVRDEGEGLPVDVERLFQPLYTTKRHGLGMGLAICRSIVASHEGRLWAERHPERGAVFHFELPLAGEEGRGTGGEGRRALR